MEAIRPTCPFCMSPWGDGAVRLLNVTFDYSDGEEPTNHAATVIIACQECDAEIYRKDNVLID